MRLVVAVLLAVASTAFASFDSVIFSSTTRISKETPSIENLLSTATKEAPVVFFVNPDFVLGQFSKAAVAYSTHESSSPLVNAAKQASSAISRYLEKPVYVPEAVYISQASNLKMGDAAVYVVTGDNWSSLDALASSLLSQVAPSASAIIVTASDAVTQTAARVKRVATSDADGTEVPFPLIMPPFNKSGFNDVKPLPCLFYLEGVNVIYTNNGKEYSDSGFRNDGTETGDAQMKYNYADTYIDCPNAMPTKENPTSVSTIRVIITPPKEGMPKSGNKKSEVSSGIIDIELKFIFDATLSWYLNEATLKSPLSVTSTANGNSGTIDIPAERKADPTYLYLNSVFGYSWNCWDTQALFFTASDTDKTKKIGISFHGLQVQLMAFDKELPKDGAEGGATYFRSKVESCTPTFSAPSWMGIIVTLVLFAIFIFGFLMLNSVQTMDRFDDPKQRQILINVRE